MLFFAVLAAATGVAALFGRRRGTWRDHARRGLAAAMVFAGLTHLVQPDPFVQHLPDWVPARQALVAITGVIEIGLGSGLLTGRRRRQRAGQLLAAYLAAVFPANVYVAVADVDVDGQPGGLYPWIRLPFQALFIAWALWSTRPKPMPPTEVGTSQAANTYPHLARRTNRPTVTADRP
jgi:uncharacterized membrane protein